MTLPFSLRWFRGCQARFRKQLKKPGFICVHEIILFKIGFVFTGREGILTLLYRDGAGLLLSSRSKPTHDLSGSMKRDYFYAQSKTPWLHQAFHYKFFQAFSPLLVKGIYY